MLRCTVCIRDWMARNRLKLNEDKTQVIWLGSRQQLSEATVKSLTLTNATVQLSDVVILAFDLTAMQLTMANHITALSRSCFFRLRQLRSTKQSLTIEAMHEDTGTRVCWQSDSHAMGPYNCLETLLLGGSGGFDALFFCSSGGLNSLSFGDSGSGDPLSLRDGGGLESLAFDGGCGSSSFSFSLRCGPETSLLNRGCSLKSFSLRLDTPFLNLRSLTQRIPNNLIHVNQRTLRNRSET